jgi:hypothetical protein
MSLTSVEGFIEVKSVAGIRVLTEQGAPRVEYLVEWKVRWIAVACILHHAQRFPVCSVVTLPLAALDCHQILLF